MRRIALVALTLGMAVTASRLGAQAGSANTTPGTVSRITLLRINPGQADAF